MGEAWWVKPEGSVETRVHRQLPGSELRQLNVDTPCLLQIINSRLPTGNTISITTVVEVASGKGHA